MSSSALTTIGVEGSKLLNFSPVTDAVKSRFSFTSKNGSDFFVSLYCCVFLEISVMTFCPSGYSSPVLTWSLAEISTMTRRWLLPNLTTAFRWTQMTPSTCCTPQAPRVSQRLEVNSIPFLPRAVRRPHNLLPCVSGCGASHRRSCRGSELVHVQHIRRAQARGDALRLWGFQCRPIGILFVFIGLVCCLWPRLGRRSFLHRLRPSPALQHDSALWGERSRTWLSFLSALFHHECHGYIRLQGKPVGTPDPSSYYRMLTDHRIVAMFVAPTAMRALRREVKNLSPLFPVWWFYTLLRSCLCSF